MRPPQRGWRLEVLSTRCHYILGSSRLGSHLLGLARVTWQRGVWNRVAAIVRQQGVFLEAARVEVRGRSVFAFRKVTARAERRMSRTCGGDWQEENGSAKISPRKEWVPSTKTAVVLTGRVPESPSFVLAK